MQNRIELVWHWSRQSIVGELSYLSVTGGWTNYTAWQMVGLAAGTKVWLNRVDGQVVLDRPSILFFSEQGTLNARQRARETKHTEPKKFTQSYLLQTLRVACLRQYALAGQAQISCQAQSFRKVSHRFRGRWFRAVKSGFAVLSQG